MTSPLSLARAPRGDVAAHADGPSPAVRAFVGLGCGLAVGVLAALLTPRPARAVRPPAGP